MSDERHPDTGKIVRGRLVLEGGSTMTASCFHRSLGACGGCYARLYKVLVDIRHGKDAKAVLSEVFEQTEQDTRVMKGVKRE